MKRAIVTGGAGFVGSNLVRTLQQRHRDIEVLVIDDFRRGTFANLCGRGDDPFVFRGQVIARPLIEAPVPDVIDSFEPDAIFHLASITDTTVDDEAKMMIDNVEPFEELLELSLDREIPLVWASSAATYGTEAGGAVQAGRPFALKDAGKPANVYGFSKWVMENAHRQALKADPKAHIVGLRYFNVFGPHEQNKGHMASMIYQLAQQMLDGKRPRVFYDGNHARDQVYVQDVVDATLAAAQPEALSGIYNLGSGSTLTFNQIIEALNEAFGTDLEPDYFDNPYAFYQPYTCADLTATRKGLNWSPQHEPREAVIRYARWLQQQRQ